MKKILILILVLISVESYSQIYKLYAIRQNTDATRDSFFTKFPSVDSVFNKNGVFVSMSVEITNQLNLEVPSTFSDYIKKADNIYENIPLQFASGTYTPTLFNTTNVAASSSNTCAWIRINNTVFVTGTLSIDATTAASTLTELGVSLPLASNIAGAVQCSGTAASDNVASLSARIKGDAANDRATISFRATSSANDTYSFTFSYIIQ